MIAKTWWKTMLKNIYRGLKLSLERCSPDENGAFTKEVLPVR